MRWFIFLGDAVDFEGQFVEGFLSLQEERVVGVVFGRILDQTLKNTKKNA